MSPRLRIQVHTAAVSPAQRREMSGVPGSSTSVQENSFPFALCCNVVATLKPVGCVIASFHHEPNHSF